ncbi:MAG: DUF261 family protein [Spirochaetia bacterium]|nr:DUF261 family protein [Spirochaetia bacterium]
MKYDQSFMKAIGEYGCYALCIINIAEQVMGKRIDKLAAIENGIATGSIEWHDDNYRHPDNMYVERPNRFLSLLTGGKKWSVRKESDILYKPKKGEYIVERWTRNGYGHFARTRDGYNSLQDSKCVTLGKIESLRVFKETA